jgi:hypothetical protein
MELMYLAAMEEHGLTESDLSEDAQLGIEQIELTVNAMEVAERNGKMITERTFKKLKALDKWVYYEIMDMVNETDNNDDEMPDVSDEIDNLKNADGEELEDDGEDEYELGNPEVGKRIDAQLDELFKRGKRKITLDELKNVSRDTYNIIFENYDDSGKNGVETSNYTLTETHEYEFTLTKK